SPNPAVVTVLAPRAPPVPLPAPAPVGRSKEPRLAILPGLPGLPSPLIPFGSPNPPVCTCAAGRFGFIGSGALNIPVRTSGFGGAGCSGLGIFRTGGSMTAGGFTSTIFGGSGGLITGGGGGVTTGFTGGGTTIGFSILGSGFGLGGCL